VAPLERLDRRSMTCRLSPRKRRLGQRTPYHEPMRRAVTALGIVLVLAGAVWTAQGLGVPIGDSFMISDRAWVIIGLITALAGAAAIGWARQRT
jgi:hypothetical protein